jgi:enolase
MTDYYFKMVNEHPLLTFIEDAFAQFDFVGHKALQTKVKNDIPNVSVSIK